MANAPNRWSRFWTYLWSRPRRWFMLGVPIGGIAAFLFGILFWGGFNTALEMTNNEQFCTGCHEMRDNVYQEYKGTIHDKNRTGVRATCPDCHVPHPWIYKMKRKIQHPMKSCTNCSAPSTPAKSSRPTAWNWPAMCGIR